MDIKVGDKVRYTGPNEHDLTHGKVYKVSCVGLAGPGLEVIDDVGDENFLEPDSYEPVTDTPQAPTLWRDMTDAEKGALLLAHYEGEVIEYYAHAARKWLPADDGGPYWMPTNAYRIKPEPKVEPRNLYVYAGEGDMFLTRVGTIDLINGEPDPASIKMERMRD